MLSRPRGKSTRPGTDCSSAPSRWPQDNSSPPSCMRSTPTRPARRKTQPRMERARSSQRGTRIRPGKCWCWRRSPVLCSSTRAGTGSPRPRRPRTTCRPRTDSERCFTRARMAGIRALHIFRRACTHAHTQIIPYQTQSIRQGKSSPRGSDSRSPPSRWPADNNSPPSCTPTTLTRPSDRRSPQRTAREHPSRRDTLIRSGRPWSYLLMHQLHNSTRAGTGRTWTTGF